MFLQRACNTMRMGLLRRAMSTGRRPETPERLTPVQHVAAFSAFFFGILGPGIYLMLTRDKPLSEH